MPENPFLKQSDAMFAEVSEKHFPTSIRFELSSQLTLFSKRQKIENWIQQNEDEISENRSESPASFKNWVVIAELKLNFGFCVRHPDFAQRRHRTHKMKSIKASFLLLFMAMLPLVKSAILEALIQVESDNIQMTSFLERFKKFIAQSHLTPPGAIDGENNTSVDKYVQHNDTFQANYDFSQNLLTIRSSYNLLQNKTGEKISDVKISINFRFNQDPNRKIIIEDFHGHDAEPRIGIDNITTSEDTPDENKQDANYQKTTNLLGGFLSPIVNVLEPVIVAFFHIVVNGILGHVLTSAFEELYHGRLLSH